MSEPLGNNPDNRVFTTDTVNATRDPLLRVFRVVLFKEGITIPKMSEMYLSWVRRVYPTTRGSLALTAQRHNNNDRKAIVPSQTKITWDMLRKIFDVLDFHIVNVSITIRRPSGEEVTYEASQVVQDEPLPKQEEAIPSYVTNKIVDQI